MTEYEKTFLMPTASLRHALEIIDGGGIKIALIVDSDRKLLGTLSDGDARRAILRGAQLSDPIDEIYHRSPTVCRVNDSREKVLHLAATHKLYQIPVLDCDGTIVGIAEVGELLSSTKRSNKVVLMAGGLGTRLRPLTDETPKPMLKVGSKPILETIIENFSKYGFVDIIISLNYKSNVIQQYFRDGADFGVNIEYVTETTRLGTAGALSLIREKLVEPFFVMNADLLTNVNFQHMFDYHADHMSAATMAVREYGFEVPYGVVNIENGRVLSIDEKPMHKCFVSAGIYMLSAEVLKHVPDSEFFDMPSLFEKLICEKKEVVSFPIREYWLDIGKHSDFVRANEDYTANFSND